MLVHKETLPLSRLPLQFGRLSYCNFCLSFDESDNCIFYYPIDGAFQRCAKRANLLLQVLRDFVFTLSPTDPYLAPILNHVPLPYSTKQIDAKLFPNASNPDDIYRLPPSPAVDAAWDRISANSIFPISESDVLRINKDPSTALTAPPDWGFEEGAYIVEIDVFHQIHCLNALRKALITNYDHYYGSRYGLEPPLMFQTHLGHCTSILLQNLMCHADVEVITHVWQEDQDWPYPDFGISKQCRNFESLLEWKEENELEGMGEKYLGYAKPPHAVQLPREPGMVDLGNGTGIKHGVVTGPIPVNVCNYSQD